jgi:CubicO group peptidase (beta-lactamase class C family)
MMSRGVGPVIGLVVAFGLPPRPADAQSPLADLPAYVERVRSEWGAPGIAVAVVKDDSIVFLRGFGVREVGKPEPVDEHSVFAIASTSKAFTAAALAMLVDRGRLQWNDPVETRLPGFRLYDPYASHELTVRDLLSHRSGLPRGDALWYASPFDRQEVLRRVRYLEPGWSFRSRYGYQNLMLLAAGEIIPAVTDTSWDDFVRVHIFEPLGMRSTVTSVRRLPENHTMPHGRIDGMVTPMPWRNFDNLGGAGAVISSAADLAQWMRLQLGRGVYRGDTLLSDSVAREMWTAQTVVPPDEDERALFPESHLYGYGMGWRLQDYRGRLIVRHGGALDGMRTHIALVPEERLGVVAITNFSESRVPQAVVWRVIDAYLTDHPKDWNARYRERARGDSARADSTRRAREAERATGTTPTHALPAFAGTYESVLYGEAEVGVEEGKLVLRIGPSYVGDLEHWHYDTFRAAWRDRYLGRDFVTFHLDHRGRIAAVEVEGFGRFGRKRETRDSGQ